MGRSRRYWYYLVFFGAGMPALIYQVVWQRVLSLYFGVDIYSVSVTIGTFMLGLGLGSLLGGRIADRVRKPAVIYATVEALLGCFGAFSLLLFSSVGSWFAGSSITVLIPVDFLLLLIPTTLMGTTLPLMCRVVVARDELIGQDLARLYALNTLGAAVGALLSAYLLIGIFGLSGAAYIAAAFNVILALVMYALSTVAGASQDTSAVSSSNASQQAESSAVETNLSYAGVLFLSFLSGFLALGYEVVWYRILGCLLHGTVYVFGTILFFYLIGIALGSLRAQRRIDQENCAARFALSQLGISAYVFAFFMILGYLSWMPGLKHLIAASSLTSFHPAPELVTAKLNIYSVYSILDVALWAGVVLLPPTILMGYGFPNLVREGSRRVATLGHSVGTIFFANILGATVGSLVAGFIGVHYLGSETTLRIMVVLGCVPALLVFLRHRLGAAPAKRRRSFRWVLATLTIAILAATVFPGKSRVLRAVHYADQEGVDCIVEEDRTGVVVLRRQNKRIAFSQEDKILNLWRLYIDGGKHGGYKSFEDLETNTPIELALAAHPAPRKVLCIGLGDGKMCATAALHEEVEELTIVELSSALRRVIGRTAQVKAIFESGKVNYVVDDGRRWLLENSEESFDFILMFPLHAAHAYSGNLFSKEFMEIAKAHLNKEGILYLSSVDVYSTSKTLASVFPHILRIQAGIYLASSAPFRLDPTRLLIPVEEVIELITADRDTILANTQDALINRDFRPNSEYYLTYDYSEFLGTLGNAGEPFSEKDRTRFHKLFVYPEFVPGRN